MKSHEEWLAEVIQLAHENVAAGRRPYAGIIVRDGEIIGRGLNEMTRLHDPTAHGEIQAIRDACLRLGTLTLPGAVMYANGQPCPMCVAAAYWAGIEAIYYAASVEECAQYMPASPMGRFVSDLSVPGAERAVPFVHLPVDGRLEPFAKWAEQQQQC